MDTTQIPLNLMPNPDYTNSHIKSSLHAALHYSVITLTIAVSFVNAMIVTKLTHPSSTLKGTIILGLWLQRQIFRCSSNLLMSDSNQYLEY